MIRKAVLLGCTEGPWTSIHGFKRPRLRVQGSEGIEVIAYGDNQTFGYFTAGEHDIPEGQFFRVRVSCGDPESAICDVLSGAA